MSDHLTVDGAAGEGGGQIVRSSLALSLVTGRPVTIHNIRAGRRRGGLLQQHLTAARAVAEICGGSLTGDAAGSRTLTFEPQPVRPGGYHFRVGTAGSATLVLQTVLPALLTAGAPSSLTLEGGTHNGWAPPFDFLARVYLPLVNRMGPQVSAKLQRHGFYPAGGGRFTVQIDPAAELAGFDLLDRGEIESQSARILLADLPTHIGDRESQKLARKLKWQPRAIRVEELKGEGPGNVMLAEIVSTNITELFTSFGQRGVPAEQVAADLARQILRYRDAKVPVGEYLADQLLLLLGLSAWQTGASDPARPVQRGGSFRTLPLSSHSTTHIEILRQFLDVAIDVEDSEDGTARVRVAPGTPPTGGDE